MLFHQVARYTAAKFAIDMLRTQECHKILEVGSGSHGNLAKFLCDDKIVFLDSVLTEEAKADSRFVEGNALNLSFDDNSFDFVIGLDVLEHIDKTDRPRFIDEVYRVAKYGVFLTFPHFSKEQPFVDEDLKSFYQSVGVNPPIWIDEHVDCTLPDADEVLSYVRTLSNDIGIYHKYAISRHLMDLMLRVEAVTSRYSYLSDYFKVINDNYIESLLLHDIGNDALSTIKSYIIISKTISSFEIETKFNTYYNECHRVIEDFSKKLINNFGWAINLGSLDMSDRLLSNSVLLKNDTSNIFEGVNALKDESINILKNIHSVRDDVKCCSDSIVLTSDKINEIVNDEKNEISEVNKNVSEIFGSLMEINHFTEKTASKLSLLVSEKPVVDVILITYNQSKFIEETVRSLISQKVNFPVRVLVADDCSSDDTVEIIRRVASESEIEFEYLANDCNLGIMKNYKRAIGSCTAEYVAILEGDDIWVDPMRLQNHIDFLRAHSECSMSFNRYVVKNFEEGTFHIQPRFSAEDEKQPYRYITGHDLAYDNLIGNFSTSVYRLSSLRSLPEQLFDMNAYDWLTNILVSKMGFIGCLMSVSSIYRIHSKGVWSSMSRQDQLNDLIATIDKYNRYTDYEFTGGFTAHRDRLVAELNSYTIQEIIPVPEIQKLTIKKVIKKCIIKMYQVSRYIPPIFVQIVKLFVPKALQDYLRSKCT